MAETLNDNIDQLPELGTKAAAVAAIESLIFRAIGAKDLEPLQLRYWLDAYYQARLAQETEDEESPRTTEQQIDVHKLEEAILRWEHQRPHLIARVTYDGLRLSPDESSEREARIATAPAEPRNDKMEADGADVSAPPEQADASDGQNPPAADAAAPFRQGGLDGGPSGTSAPTEAEERKPKQRPVGWSDGNQLPTDPETYSGAAAAAKFKREQFERLQRFLREGVTMQRIVKAADGNITEDQILGIRECRRVPVAVYRVLAAALDRIETD